MVWLTFLGGNNGLTVGTAIAADPQGNVYATGYTFANNFPIQSAFQENFASTNQCSVGSAVGICSDGFITQIKSDGSALIYSSYLGGNSLDNATTVQADSSGNAYVAGYTASSNFP